MTAPQPPPDRSGLLDSARWLRGLSATLDEVAARVARLAGDVGQDWPDVRSREWVERMALLQRELQRDAVAAVNLAADVVRLVVEPASVQDPGWPVAPVGTRRTGVRLGGTEARRTDDEHGVRIAELPEPGTAPG